MPNALAIGISESAFWGMDMNQMHSYATANNIRTEHENYIAWLSGLYVFKAICAALDSKHYKYPEKPFRITPMTETEKQANKEEQLKKFIAYCDRMAITYKDKP